MSPRPRTTSDEDLLKAVHAVVTRLGPNLTLADVAKEAGVSAATLVQRFGSKRGLLLAFAALRNHDRVGAAGVSLGGYYAPRAALEPRVKAVAGVSGAFNFGECWEGLPGLTRETFEHHSGAGSAEEARERAFGLDLGPVIRDVDCPGLMITGKLDRIIPWEQTKRIADEAPNTRFVLYDEGNHVCNNIPFKYRPLVADWLKKELADVG